MSRLLDSPEFQAWTKALPTPIAKPLIRIDSAFQREDGEFLGSCAALDVFEAIIKWTTFLGIADIYQKLTDQHPFLERSVMEQVYPHINRVLEPGQAHGHWVGCIREIFKAYKKHPDLFFIPSLARSLSSEKAPLLAALSKMLILRNEYTHESSSYPTRNQARILWRKFEPLLITALEELSILGQYNLVQFFGGLYPQGSDVEGFQIYKSSACFRLHGYHSDESRDIRVKKPLEFQFPVSRRIQHNELYFFDPQYKNSINLHPWVLFAEIDNENTAETKTFLFNELKEKVAGVAYQAFDGTGAVELNLVQNSEEEQRNELLTGPLFQHFTGLKVILTGRDIEEAAKFPGFGHKSPVINFSRLIDFHVQSFAGREDVMANVLAFLGAMGGGIWIRGTAGLGKTAFMAKLAHEHNQYIHYFISNDRRTYEARTFLLHTCELIKRRYRLEMNISADATIEQLIEIFHKMLEQVSRMVASGNAEKLVILIDALDESERYISRPEDNITRVFPDTIPQGVFLIFSSRPDLELDQFANLREDLNPLKESEVKKILSRLNWGDEEASITYRRSGGNPLFLRLVIDDIKAGKLTPKGAQFLPSDVNGIYQKFIWSPWTEAQQKAEHAAESGKSSKESQIRKGEEAKYMQEILGFLAVSREPLSLDQLAQLLDGPDQQTLRKLIAPEQLGRMLIGRTTFSIFHDTLRDFVRKTTRPNDDQPYGDGISFHRRLARWSNKWQESEYGKRHLPFHLLHSRSFSELFELLDDNSETGFFKSKTNDTEGRDDLAADLQLTIAAAREQNDIPKILRFGVLRQSVISFQSTQAIEGSFELLAQLGRSDEVLRMLGAMDDQDELWKITSGLFAVEAEKDFDRAIAIWGKTMKTAWSSGESWARRGNILVLLTQCHALPTESIIKLRELFSDIENDDWGEAVVDSLFTDPIKAISCLPRNFKSTNVNFFILAASTLQHDEEAAWDLLGRITEIEPDSFPYFIPFFRRNLQRALKQIEPSLRPDTSRFNFSPWKSALLLNQTLAFGIAIDRDVTQDWLDSASLPIKSVGLAVLAERTADGKLVDEIVPNLAEWFKNLSLHSMIQLLIFVTYAARASSHPMTEMLNDTLVAMSGLLGKSSNSGMGSLDDLETIVTEAAGKCGPWYHLVQDFVEDKDVAHLLALLLASPARPWLNNPKFQELVAMESLQPQTGVGDSALLSFFDKALQIKISDSMFDRDDFNNLAIPFVIGSNEAANWAERLEPLMPWGNAYSPRNEGLFVLQPDISLTDLRKLQGVIRDSDGDHPSLTKLATVALGESNLSNPDAVLERWRKWRQEMANEDENNEESESSTGYDIESIDDFSDVDDLLEELDDIDAEEFDVDDINGLDDIDLDDLDDDCSDLAPPQSHEGLSSFDGLDGDFLPALFLLWGREEQAILLLKETGTTSNFWALLLAHMSGQTIPEQFVENLMMLAESRDLPHDEDLLIKIMRITWTQGLEKILIENGIPESLDTDYLTLLGKVAYENENSEIGRNIISCIADRDSKPAILIPWIKSVFRVDTVRAESMWQSLESFIQGKKREFFNHLEHELDELFEKHLWKSPLTSTETSGLCKDLPQGFSRTRVVLITQMIIAGWDQASLESLLVKNDDISLFQNKLFNIPMPEWLLDRWQREIIELIEEALEPQSLLALDKRIFWSGWGTERRRKLVGIWSNQLKEHREQIISEIDEDADPQYLADTWIPLFEALSQAIIEEDWTIWSTIAPDQKESVSRIVSGSLLDADCHLAWQAVEAFPDANWRDETKPWFVLPGLNQDPEWISGKLKEIKSELVLEKFDQTLDFSKKAWLIVENWCVALSSNEEIVIPYDRWDFPTAFFKELGGRRPELAAGIARRLDNPMDLISDLDVEKGDEFGCELIANLFEFIVSHFETSFTKEVSSEHNARSFLEKAASLAALLFQHSHTHEAEVLNELIVSKIRSLSRGWWKNILDGVLVIIAESSPRLAIEMAKEFQYDSVLIEKAFKMLAKSDPEITLETFNDFAHLSNFDEVLKGMSSAIFTRPLLEAKVLFNSHDNDLKDFGLSAVEKYLDDETALDEILTWSSDASWRLSCRIKRLRALQSNGHEADSDILTIINKTLASCNIKPSWSSPDFVLPDGSNLDINMIIPIMGGLDPVGCFKIVDGWKRKAEKLAIIDEKQEAEAQKYIDRVRALSIPQVLLYSPDYAMEHWKEWISEEWWKEIDNDEIIDAIGNLDPEFAIMVLFKVARRFGGNMDQISKLLEGVDDSCKLHECLEVLLVEGMDQKSKNLEEIIGLLLKHASRAGYQTSDLITRLAHQLGIASKFMDRTQFESFEDLVTEMTQIAEGQVKEAETHEEVRTEPTETELKTLLSNEDLEEVNSYETIIKLKKNRGEDTAIFEGQRWAILISAKPTWEDAQK